MVTWQVSMLNTTAELLEAIPSEYVPIHLGGTSEHAFDADALVASMAADSIAPPADASPPVDVS